MLNISTTLARRSQDAVEYETSRTDLQKSLIKAKMIKVFLHITHVYSTFPRSKNMNAMLKNSAVYLTNLP